ncbi:MAG: hypothetical protein OXU81_04800 [Gammaproteobacteria bacterium]|nr:hypothetical protein [Gammaproteobacteria bacterium]
MNMLIRRAPRVLLVALTGLMVVMTGCARTSTAPLDADTIEITVRVATICDGKDAERIAHRHAAVETIKRGFDDYIVIDSVGGDHLAAHAPLTARSTLYGNSSEPLLWEDAPLLAHHRVLTVRMFQAGQGESSATVSAHAVLGDDWEALVTKGAPTTCLGGDG